MFVLEIISGPYRGQAVKLVQGKVITIGRGAECTVTFADSQLSARHAEFDWSEQGFSVFDLGSSNGTFINGRRLEGRASMALGDHLQVGQTIFLLSDEDLEFSDLELIDTEAPKRGQMLAMSSARTQITPEKKRPAKGQMLALDGKKTEVQKRSAQLQVDDLSIAAAARLKDVVAAGGHGSKVVVQRDGRHDPFWSTPVTIGREQASGIVLDDSSVSLRHAVIDLRDGRYLIRDLGSSNGTYRNGRRIVEETLADGDVLSIGSYAILVVLGNDCLGLDLQPPNLSEPQAARRSTSLGKVGVIGEPLGKKKKRKASELIWYATSDLDRGAFKSRSAIISILIGGAVTAFMLGSGDSEILAGNRLSSPHESEAFSARTTQLGREQCTACHIGAGRISTLRCLDCHPHNRPSEGHVLGDVECIGCHIEHRGPDFRPAAAAVLGCDRCHFKPHDKLVRLSPKMVEKFSIDAVADVAFHLHHEEQGVACLKCHDPKTHSKAMGIRHACGQCHAPDHPKATDCQRCHFEHPDRTKTSSVVLVLPPAQPPPKFASRSLMWGAGMIVLSFLLAALVPKKRRTAAIAASTESGT